MDPWTPLVLIISCVPIVIALGVIAIVDGQGHRFRKRTAGLADRAVPVSSAATGFLPFEPLQLPAVDMRWPSETAIRRPTATTLAWPSSGWNDPHFGAAARALTKVTDANNDVQAAQTAQTTAARSAQTAATRSNRAVPPLSPPVEVDKLKAMIGDQVAQTAAPARKAPGPPKADDSTRLETAAEIRAATDKHGIAWVARELVQRRGWTAAQAAKFIREKLQL